MTVAALLVTSNSQRWIALTLETLKAQTQQPDEIVVIDDNSTDDTRRIIHDVLGGTATVVRATSRAEDITTRIAHNFHQGIRACVDHDVVVLGDHDDLWHPDRIARQAKRIGANVEMTAADGRLIDVTGAPKGGTLRDAFPVPADWAGLDARAQTEAAVRRSIATGGASAVAPRAFADLTIPAGWLHDRWWSLVATVRGGMDLDPEALIDYRVSETQEVGLSRGRQAQSASRRLVSAAQHAPEVVDKLVDLSTRLRPLATEAGARKALAWPALVRTLA